MIIPKFLIPHFRTNHAGETGAVFIYKGILSISKDSDIINFSKKHLQTESEHLEILNNILPPREISKLIPLWKIMGFLTGFIPGIFGKDFIYATIFSVESFVEKHYQNQLDLIKGKKKFDELTNLINQLMHDEVEHKNEANQKIRKKNFLHKFWSNIVYKGSSLAVKISKYI